MALKDLLPRRVVRALQMLRLRHGPGWTPQHEERARVRQRRLEEQRDRLRQRFHAERERAAELQKRLRFPHDTWLEQRAVLAGPAADVGLRPLWYYPGDTGNPYMRILYSRLPERGLDPRGLVRFDDIAGLGTADVFHLHWTGIAQAGAKTRADAVAKSGRVLEEISTFVARGGAFLWSVHEPLPHECPHPDVEAEFRQALADLATGIHLLHKSTMEATRPYYAIEPSKAFVVEHPLYRGFYASYVTRASARRQLGLTDEDVMLLGFGAQRPYKGFDRLVRLLPRLRAETGAPVRVMLAGPKLRSVENRELLDLVAATEGVTVTDRPVGDELVHVLFRAADVAVLPYREVLNSGVLMLSLSFACPAVAPHNPVTIDTVESGLVHLFDRTSDEDLLRAMRAAMDRRDHRPELPAAFATRHDPVELAGLFAQHAATLLDAR